MADCHLQEELMLAYRGCLPLTSEMTFEELLETPEHARYRRAMAAIETREDLDSARPPGARDPPTRARVARLADLLAEIRALRVLYARTVARARAGEDFMPEEDLSEAPADEDRAARDLLGLRPRRASSPTAYSRARIWAEIGEAAAGEASAGEASADPAPWGFYV